MSNHGIEQQKFVFDFLIFLFVFMITFIIFLKKSRQSSFRVGGSDDVYAGIKHELLMMGFVHHIPIDESHILNKPAFCAR